MKKIIILGATGNVGIYLTEHFVKAADRNEYEIIACGTRETDYFKRFGIRYFRVDISNAASFDALPTDDVYAIIMLAGVLPAYHNSSDPARYIDVNTKGMLNVLEYSRKTGTDRVLYAQTYSDLAGYMNTGEALKPYAPRKINFTGDHAIYCISKCAAIDLMEHYYQEYGIKKIVFRLPNIYLYSPQTHYLIDGKPSIIPYRYMIDRAIKGETIELWGNPEKSKDIVYVKDLCRMFFKATFADNIKNSTYNVGTGRRVTMLEQVQGIIDVFSPPEHKSQIKFCPEKTDCVDFIMDIENARRELGYEPKYDYLAYLEDYKKEMNSDRFECI